MWSEVVAAYQGETCSAVQKVNFGGSVQDWIDYLTSHPGLITSEPVPVTLGAATGQAIDISVAPDWTKGCQDNPAGSGPQAMLFIQGPGASQNVFYGIAAPDRMHLTFVDVGGRTVVVAVYGPESPGSFSAVVADVQPVIESMRFAP